MKETNNAQTGPWSLKFNAKSSRNLERRKACNKRKCVQNTFEFIHPPGSRSLERNPENAKKDVDSPEGSMRTSHMYSWRREKKEKAIGCPIKIKFLGGKEKWKGQLMASGSKLGEGTKGPRTRLRTCSKRKDG